MERQLARRRAPNEIPSNPVSGYPWMPVPRFCEVADPQAALADIRTKTGNRLSGKAAGTIGHRTVFARVSQGKLKWWQPLALEIIEAKPATPIVFTTDWTKPLPPSVKLDVVPLDALFNEKVAGIFKQDYVSPRSPHVSLALPRHGYGSWCHPKDSYEVDDSGIRKAARRAQPDRPAERRAARHSG